MITPKTIKTTVTRLLKNSFAGIDVISQNVEEGFKQPSFTVRIEDYKAEIIQESLEQSMIVRLFYFPNFSDNEYHIDLLEKQFDIARIFGNKLYVEDRALNITEPSMNVVDGILDFEFSLLFEQYDESLDDEEAAPFIKNLHYEMESE